MKNIHTLTLTGIIFSYSSLKKEMTQKATFCKHFAAILQRSEAVKRRVTGYLIYCGWWYCWEETPGRKNNSLKKHLKIKSSHITTADAARAGKVPERYSSPHYIITFHNHNNNQNKSLVFVLAKPHPPLVTAATSNRFSSPACQLWGI